MQVPMEVDEAGHHNGGVDQEDVDVKPAVTGDVEEFTGATAGWLISIIIFLVSCSFRSHFG